MATVADNEIESRQNVRNPSRTPEIGYRGGTHVHTLADIPDYRGIGVWVTDDFQWAKGYRDESCMFEITDITTEISMGHLSGGVIDFNIQQQMKGRLQQ